MIGALRCFLLYLNSVYAIISLGLIIHGRRLAFSLFRKEVIGVITFSDLLTYTLVLIEVITLVVILSDKKTKK